MDGCDECGSSVPEIARSVKVLKRSLFAKCDYVEFLRIRLKLNADWCRHIYLPIEECHPLSCIIIRKEGRGVCMYAYLPNGPASAAMCKTPECQVMVLTSHWRFCAAIEASWYVELHLLESVKLCSFEWDWAKMRQLLSSG